MRRLEWKKKKETLARPGSGKQAGNKFGQGHGRFGGPGRCVGGLLMVWVCVGYLLPVAMTGVGRN